MPRTRLQFPTTVRRPRLLHLIDQPTLAPITLITAPAGYGKSTLAAHWARTTPRQVANVNLGPESNSLPVFLGRLATALTHARAVTSGPPAGEVTLDAIVASLALIDESGPGLVILLDDYHLIENRDVHQATEALIDSLPDRVHVILLSRTQPPLALGRLRAYGQVRELTEADLGFTPEEAQTVIPDDLVHRLTPDQVERLAERTGGWIAGIRLALASLETRDGEQVEQVIDSLAHNPWLDEYLVEEVLDALPADLRSFVLQSVHLPWLDADLCDQVLERDDSAELLRQIRRRIVFVRPGADPGTQVYHALFAECVQRIAARSQTPAQRQALHRRAATWFEGAGRLELALDHALRAAAWDRVQHHARALCRNQMDRDQHHSRLHWLRRLPESLVLADPDLARGYISALQYTGHLREARQVFAIVEPHWRASGDPVQLGYAAACRVFFAVIDGDPDGSLRHSYEALHHYPLHCAVERLHAWSVVVQAEFQHGNDAIADHAFRQAELCREQLPADQMWWILNVEPDLANHQALRGNLRTAETLNQATVRQLPAFYRRNEAKYRARLAAIYLEWNELERAAAEVDRIERDLEVFPHHIWHPEALLAVAQVAAARGELDKVESTLHRIQAMNDTHGGRIFQHRLQALQAAVWLSAGSVNLARMWAATARLQAFTWVRIFGDPDPRLVLARVELADGSHATARSRLQGLIDQAIAAKRWAELVPLTMWQVVACLALDDEPGAVEALRLALPHARQGGFVRSFATPGHDLRPFLTRAITRLDPLDAAWVRTLMGHNLWSLSGGTLESPLTTPPEILSRREMQVLELLHHGLTNREVGERLFISELTVKRHVGGILAKLNVSDRLAAVHRSSELGLIPRAPAV